MKSNRTYANQTSIVGHIQHKKNALATSDFKFDAVPTLENLEALATASTIKVKGLAMQNTLILNSKLEEKAKKKPVADINPKKRQYPTRNQKKRAYNKITNNLVTI